LFGVQRPSFTANTSQSNESIVTCARVSKTHRPILGRAARQTSFTANASQSNESVTCPRVAGTEVCGVLQGKKLIFTTMEIDFYRRGIFIFFIFLFFIFFPWKFF